MGTLTPNYNFNLPEEGGDTDAWGGLLNASWSSLDAILKVVDDLSVANAARFVPIEADILGITSTAAFSAADEVITGAWSFDALATFVSINTVALTTTGPATFSGSVDFVPASIDGAAVIYATETADGVVRKATSAEIDAQVEDTHYVTPAQLIQAGVGAQRYAEVKITDKRIIAASFTQSDVIPTNTQGEEIGTLTFTPSAIGRVLLVEAEVMLGAANQTGKAFGLWLDNEVAAKRMSYTYNYYTGDSTLHLTYRHVATSLNPIVFKLRAGKVGADAMYLNRPHTQGLLFGAAHYSSLSVTEI